MKGAEIFLVSIFLILVVTVSSSFGRPEYEDVVYLKEGGVRRGLILEQLPNEFIKIKTAYDEIFVIKMSDISKIVKERTVPQVADIGNAASQGSNAELENWYTYWALGYAGNTYEGELQNILDQIEDIPGTDHGAIAIEALGFYWPRGDKTLVGGILTGGPEWYDNEIAKTELTINSAVFSVSAMHFLTNKIGQGPFVRGDMGFAQSSIELTGMDTESSDVGIGILLGGGYGFPLNQGTRILANANFTLRRIEGDQSTTFALTIGGLF